MSSCLCHSRLKSLVSPAQRPPCPPQMPSVINRVKVAPPAVVCTCILESLAQATNAIQHQAPDQVVLHGPAVGEGGTAEQGVFLGRGYGLCIPGPQFLPPAGSSRQWRKPPSLPPTCSLSAVRGLRRLQWETPWLLTLGLPVSLTPQSQCLQGPLQRRGAEVQRPRPLGTVPGLTWLRRHR